MEDEMSRDIEDFFSVMRRYRLAVTPWVTSGMSKKGINLPQYTVLALLAETGETTMGKLTANLGTTMSAATNLIDRLLHAGLVERRRSTEDRRIVMAKLTPEGRHVLDVVQADGKKLLSDAFGRVPAAERRTCIQVLDRLARLLREKWDEKTGSAEVEE